MQISYLYASDFGAPKQGEQKETDPYENSFCSSSVLIVQRNAQINRI